MRCRSRTRSLCGPGSYADLAGARVVVVAGGVAQKPGETRLQLLKRNADVFHQIVPSVLRVAPETILLIVSNPVDIMTHLAAHYAAEFGVLHTRVFGSGTTLDTARFRALLGRHLAWIPATFTRTSSVSTGTQRYWSGRRLRLRGFIWTSSPKSMAGNSVSPERRQIDENVRRAAYQIIAGKGATYYGIGSAVAQIVDVLLHDQRAILTVCSRISGAPDYEGLTFALPHLVGGDGVMATIPLPLTPTERDGLRRSAGILREAVAELTLIH